MQEDCEGEKRKLIAVSPRVMFASCYYFLLSVVVFPLFAVLLLFAGFSPFLLSLLFLLSVADLLPVADLLSVVDLLLVVDLLPAVVLLSVVDFLSSAFLALPLTVLSSALVLLSEVLAETGQMQQAAPFLRRCSRQDRKSPLHWPLQLPLLFLMRFVSSLVIVLSV